MIEIKNLTLQRGLKVLLDKASAAVNPGQRVGLIGKNGTGKSSLFALIKGEITQDGGDISIPKNWRLASVSQETPDLDISALDYVLQGDAELQAFQTALRQAELSQQKLTQYSGNYDFYQTERAQRLAQQQAAYVKQQAQIKHLQSFIDRFKAKATKAVQAQSRMKALAKLERIAPAHLDSEFSFEFYNPDHLPNPLLKLEHADLGYEGKTVLHDITLSLESGARYGLLGVNGSGKSTFIKALAGKIDLLSGSIVHSEKLNIGYFAQHQLDTIRADQSPVWHIQQLSPEVREQEIRNFLGGFNFVGDMALQKTEPFSGGEKARLALAMIIWQKPNLLLLDEPTNHLDLDMRHALTLALQSFQGALIVVSHDRSLLEATTDSFLLIDKGRLKNFDGDLNDYRQWRLAQENAATAPAASTQSQNRKDTKRIEAQIRQEKARRSKPIQQKIDKAEKEMVQLSEIQTGCEAFLTQEDAYLEANKEKLQNTLSELAKVKTQLAQIEETWLACQEELERIETEIEKQFAER
ncbi:TPA: ATP-binding cassette domain-containing protein [Neisseria gonorrhoeae]